MKKLRYLKLKNINLSEFNPFTVSVIRRSSCPPSILNISMIHILSSLERYVSFALSQLFLLEFSVDPTTIRLLNCTMLSFPLSTTTFSKILATILLLRNFIKREFDITIAGYKWVSRDQFYPVWILYFFTVTALICFSVELVESSLSTLQLRTKICESQIPPDSGLNARILSGITSPDLYLARRNYGLSHPGALRVDVFTIVLNLLICPLICFLAFGRKTVSVVAIILCLCVPFLSVPFIRFSRRRSSPYVLSALNKTFIQILLEKLLEDGAQFDIRKEAMQSGIGRTSQMYRLGRGTCVGERPDKVPCPLLHPGKEDNEFLIYKNRGSVIVVENCEPLDAAWLAFKINDYTGEDSNTKFYAMGTLSYALAASEIAHSAMGPGPWVGVEGIGHSLIWLGIILAIGKIANNFLAIAYKVEPLSGTGIPNTDICQWECQHGKWDIYSDNDGIVRVRRARCA